MKALVHSIGAAAAIVLLGGQAVASDVAPRIADAGVERSADNVVVRWNIEPPGAPVDVYVALPGERTLRAVSRNDRDGYHELSAEHAARRPLVHLTTPSGETRVIAERLLPLEGGRNFRDLGGYATEDGRRVKWGKVYRSGTMAQLTDGDYAFLSTLGIRVVCDFRATDEREREPTLWRTAGAKTSYRTRDYRTESGLKELFGNGTPTPEAVRTAMTRLYGEMPYEHAESYRAMFKSLAAGQAPLAFNCAAGKDRTGVAAALLLSVLGVPRETVVEDYALSEKVVNYDMLSARRPAASAEAKPDPWGFLRELPPAVRAPLLRSDPTYIRAALARIEEREGSIEGYLERILTITKAEQRAIRDLLLDS